MEDYVAYLARKGGEEEKSREFVEAIATHLKLVDILLVMAEVAPSYPLWVKCTSSAEAFQKKIKSLLALATLEKEKVEAPTPVSTVSSNPSSLPVRAQSTVQS